MKLRFGLVAAAVSSAIVAGVAVAASNGYIGGAGPVSVSVPFTATVPNVLLLRVGAAAGPDGPLLLNPTISVTTSPTNWDGSLPSSTTATASVNAFAYTNNANGASLSCATTGLPTLGGNGIFATDVSVSTAALAPAITPTLSHPGANLSCTATTSITRNEVFDATWTYSLDPVAVVNGISAGSHSFSVAYTLTPTP